VAYLNCRSEDTDSIPFSWWQYLTSGTLSVTCESDLGHSFHFLARQHIVQLKNLKHRLQCIRHSVVDVCCVVVLLMPHHWCTGKLKYTVHVFSKVFLTFKVCKSVHHHTIQINQPDASTSQIYYLIFIYSSACFGCPRAHHQELNNCSSSLWFLPLEHGGSSAVGCGWAGPTTTNSTAPTMLQR
jgi:hypothetical protein